ncbi:MAG: NHLP family bacteriocin export ABC transporter peptidase/permease/ATPase subunit [Planctomycetes bacterium]|nr:NHLP family bacteriocin export ABC transporter peptidase/permease/ATPase subunit [Planctomycetota bacterium]
MTQVKAHERPTLPRRRPVCTPTLLQMEAAECGAAALGIILAHYGRWVPLEKLRVDCGVSRDGSKAANMLAAAERYEMKAEAFKMEIHELAEIRLPCILFWNFNHFVVLEGFRRRRAYLNDPAFGRKTVSDEEFDRGMSGIVLTFEPLKEFQRGGRRPSMIRALAGRLRGIRMAVSFCVLAGLGLVIPGLAIPTFSKIFVDEILIGGSTKWLGPLVLGLGIAAALRAVLTALQQHYLMRSSTKLAITTTGRFLRHVLRLPMEFFGQRHAGDITNRISGNERVASVLTGDLATSVLGLITAFFYAMLMLRYDVVLTLIGVSISLVNLLVLKLIARKRVDESQRMLQDSGKLMATAMGGVQCIESIKAAARESDFFARWSGYQAKSSAAAQRLAVSTAFVNTVPFTLSLLSTAIVLGVGGFRVMDGALTIGMLVAIQSLLISFSRPIQDLVRLGAVVQKLAGDMKRLDDVLNYQIDPILAEERFERTAAPQRRLSGFLELRNVTFGYSRLDEPLLKDFSLKLAPGDRVALVGPSGSGKSTLAKLISGLYRPWTGEVLFDGKTRETHPRGLLANSFALVDQEIFFFEGTIRENLALWDSTLPDEAIQRAAKDAHIHDDISSRRGAYASSVDEGARNFSGGQRQRLEIARALAIDPTVLVMDEATSALDAATEKIVDDNIRRRGCTCVIVAHRLSTIRDCNEIIVLDRGKVTQRGVHEDLIKADGLYARLITTE